MINVPYTAFDMRIALLCVNSKLDENEAALMELGDKLNAKYGGNNKTTLIAEHYNITNIELVNSPNYKILVEEYDEMITKELVQELCSKVGLTDKESWATVLHLTGNLPELR